MEKQVMLERIQIKNLFERFTYDINLKNGNQVAILIAPNGCGKTTIFKMIDFIFSPTLSKFSKISTIPFENCYCTLSNGRIIGLEVRKTKNKKRRNDMVHRPQYANGLGFAFGQLERDGKEIYLVINDGESHEKCINEVIFDTVKHFDEDLTFVDSIPVEVMEQLDIDDRDIPPRFRRVMVQSAYAMNSLSGFSEKFDCKIDVNFISADRLHTHSFSMRQLGYVRSRAYDEQITDPISVMQEKMKTLYKNTDSEYKKLVSEARDKLPKMFLSAHNKTKMKFDAFEKSWEEYVRDMEKYYQLGLIESTQTIIEDSELEKSFKDNGAFLTVYLEAFKSTLDPWSKEYGRMKLLADILNRRNRVTGKVLKYGPYGLVVTVDGKDLPLNCLSSGEKNDLIMFYNLIFNSEKGGLVLVDEPEISLHIEWQEEYLDCLIKICEMNQLQAIIATHSPNIVNGHFELYAERGLQDERK